MRGFWAGIALVVLFPSAPAQAGPDDYVFEFRLVNDDGREIVATCRGRSPCVLDEGLPGTVNFAVQIVKTQSDFRIHILGNPGTRFGVWHQMADGRQREGQSRWDLLSPTIVSELPAVLGVERYEGYGNVTYCLEQRYFCHRPQHLVGRGYLMIRPLPLAPGASDAR
jgi:hypothetical protein